MSDISAAMNKVLEAVIKKVVSNAEESVTDIQMKLMEVSSLSDSQKEAIRRATEEASASGAPGELLTRLQELLRANAGLSETLMPIVVSLQFQDRLRQELESLHATFRKFLERVGPGAGAFPDAAAAEEFWIACAKSYTNIESRTLVLKSALGEGYVVKEDDVRDTQAGGDDGFFF